MSTSGPNPPGPPQVRSLNCPGCGAALALQPAAPILLRPLPACREREARPPQTPALPYRLDLDHSGGAPPTA